MEHVYIQSFAAIHSTGMYSSAHGHVPWNEEQGGSPLDVQRKQVYDKLHTGFGKLNAPDKLAFSSAALLLSGFDEYNGDKTGISIGTAYGSFSTDMRYMESLAAGFPSPAYFSATLPSSPVAEVAILFKLKGPNRVLVSSTSPGFSALDNAIRILALKKADAMVVILVNGIEPDDIGIPLINAEKDRCNFSYAFMVTPHKYDSGSNYILSLTQEKSLQNNSQNCSEESYFLEVIMAMMENKDFSNSIILDHMHYTLTLEKEI